MYEEICVDDQYVAPTLGQKVIGIRMPRGMHRFGLCPEMIEAHNNRWVGTVISIRENDEIVVEYPRVRRSFSYDVSEVEVVS